VGYIFLVIIDCGFDEGSGLGWGEGGGDGMRGCFWTVGGRLLILCRIVGIVL
jgi:hypothetical protein